MKLWQDSKRFFEPLLYKKSVYVYGILIYFVRAFDSIVVVLFLETFISLLWENLQEQYFQIIWFYLIYLLYYVIFNVLFHRKSWTEISDTSNQFLQRKYLQHYVKLDNNKIEKLWTGKLIAIIDKWIDTWSRWIDIFLINIAVVITTFFFACYMIWKNSWILLIVFLFLYVCFFYLANLFNKWAIKYRSKRRDAANLRKKNLVKVIMSKNEILTAAKINSEVDILDYYSQKEIFYNKKMSPYLNLLFEFPSLVLSLFVVYLFYSLGNQYFNWSIGIAQIVWITAAFAVMQNSINNSLDFFKNFTKEFTDIEKLWNFFDNTPVMTGYEEWNNFEYKTWKIEIQNISYGYWEWNSVFTDFNLNITWWTITALVWPSGWWKSTLVKLIAAYIRPDKWEIIIDWQKLSKTALKSYYQSIGYLTQEASVFDGTISENLSYALNWEVSDEKMNEVLALAKCEFVREFEHGVDTEIWEKWIRLSWWQRQRLAIAKIFLKNPHIIILDEPTSALDSFSEKKISEAMENLFAWRTVIIIAHRLQTVKHADTIIYIQDWKIVEQGNHETLSNDKNSKYKEMLDLQSGF